jgi:hypothetical protein
MILYSNNILITNTGEHRVRLLDFSMATFDDSKRYQRRHNENKLDINWRFNYVKGPVLAMLKALPNDKNGAYDAETVQDCISALGSFKEEGYLDHIEAPLLEYKGRQEAQSSSKLVTLSDLQTALCNTYLHFV